MSKKMLSYGLWPSPLSPTSMSLQRRLSDVQWDTDGRTLVWLEGRSDQNALVAQDLNGGAPRDLTEGQNARASVGYGGGDFTVSHGHVYYVDHATKGIHRLALDAGAPALVTPGFGAAASPVVSADGRWLLYVHSDHDVDCLALVDSAGAFWPQRIASGADFYMQPAWHPAGQRVAWIEWNHPDMPWDHTRLVLATLEMSEGALPRVASTEVLCDQTGVATAEPQFSPDGRYLVYLSDQGGWSNLWCYDLETKAHRQLTADTADIGLPAWRQGMRTHQCSPDSTAVFYIRSRNGKSGLWSVSLREGAARALATPLAHYSNLSQLAVAPTGDRIAILASASAIPTRIASVDLKGNSAERIHAYSSAERIPAEAYAAPEAVQWTTNGGDTVYGLYYPPHHPVYESSGKPPAIVLAHGGPTGQVTAGFNAQAQFFATRGYAVLAVNYRGSAGYGRAYIEKLKGQWGVYDVEDTASGAQFLVDAGLADPGRLVVMGGSAGGLTVLLALANHPGLFRAGVCMYGVSNLFTLATDTHKFESHYLDSLIGPLPQDAAKYRERSAIYCSDRIVDPIAIFQGEEDRVVPKEQSDSIVASLRERGVTHEYHVYPGEGHGWRKTETIVQFYEALLRFLRNHVVLG